MIDFQECKKYDDIIDRSLLKSAGYTDGLLAERPKGGIFNRAAQKAHHQKVMRDYNFLHRMKHSRRARKRKGML